MRFIHGAARTAQPNHLWFIGCTPEFQEESLAEIDPAYWFELGDEIEYQKAVRKVVAIEIFPLAPSLSLPVADKVITYYIASSVFPLM
ncbi:hypothetical protein [Marinococcus luteus]|uniref:hypothetical protein n=1 Tax=Marinococcus luteus TaxID=1122204 RepID=UPI002ACCCBC8|nr:hypothetical protein [Marinococcus luteus]MDZ5783121.1 hypothetical protein [Marinococcus luteus]